MVIIIGWSNNPSVLSMSGEWPSSSNLSQAQATSPGFYCAGDQAQGILQVKLLYPVLFQQTTFSD